MRIKKTIRKKGIEKLLRKGLVSPVPYSDYMIVCYEKSERVRVVKRYEIYKPTADGEKFIRIEDIEYFQK